MLALTEWDRADDPQLAFAEAEVVRLEGLICRIRGRQAQLLAALDRHQVDTADGARTMAEWVSAKLDLSPQTSSRLMTVARSDHPGLREQMLAGSWGLDRASWVAKLAALGLDHRHLGEVSDSYSLGQLFGLWERNRKLSSADESFDYEWRYLVAQPSLDSSMLKLWGQLPGADGEIVLNALHKKETSFPVLEEQNAGQRRADALTAICLDSLTGTHGEEGAKGREVTVAEVFIDAALAAATGGEAGATLSGGSKVGPNTLGEILCGGKVRVVNCTETHPISYSDLSDTIPPAIRNFVRFRDQGACAIEGCRSRYRVQPHHIRERHLGGSHHIENLISLCWYHHHVAIHQRGMIIDPDSPIHRRQLIWPEPQRGPPG